MERDAKIDVIGAIMTLGFMLSVYVCYINENYDYLVYPHTTPLFNPLQRFSDFHILYTINAGLNPYLQPTPSAQYPLANMVAYVFRVLPLAWATRTFVVIVGGGFAALAAWQLASPDRARHVSRAATFSLLCYPLLFTLDRGNYEGFVFLAMALFVILDDRGRRTGALIALAVAIALKLIPGYLVLLLVARRRYRDLAVVLGLFVAIELVCLACFRGGFWSNLRFLLHGSNTTANPTLVEFISGEPTVQRGVSLLNATKITLHALGLLRRVDMGLLLRGYLAVMAVVSGLVAFFVVFVEKVRWRQVAMLVAAMLLLPHISAEYKLLHVFIIIFAFVNSRDRGPSERFYAIVLGLLVIPKDYGVMEGIRSDSGRDVTFGSIANVGLLILLMNRLVSEGLALTSRAAVRAELRAHWQAVRALFGRGATTNAG